MEQFILTLKQELENSLQEIERNETDVLKRAGCCIDLLEQNFDRQIKPRAIL